MKNIQIKSLLFFISFSVMSFAQSDKGFYVSINSGYNFGTGNPDYFQSAVLGIIESNQTSATEGTSAFNKIPLGKGVNVGANFGYMFTKNLGFELGANYLFGGKTTANQKSYTGDYSTSHVFAKMIQIKPTLVFRAGFEKLNPYAKVGLAIGSGKIYNTQIEKSGADINIDEFVFEKGIPIGFTAGLGAQYSINNKIALFGELCLVSIEYAPDKGALTLSTKNGVDQLPSKTIKQKELEFVSSFVETGAPSNPNEPSKQVRLPFSFNSFGFNVGLQYQF
jgi:opacity protein-like surface antigen